MEALLTAVKHRRPMGKGARSAVYRALRQLYQAIPVGQGRYGWLSFLLQGSVVRHPLTPEEARRSYLLLDELEHALFFPQFFQDHRPDNRTLTLDLMGGSSTQAVADIERKTWSLRLGVEFAEWLDDMGGQGRDDLVIRVDDAIAGHYTLRVQPQEARDEELIHNRNIQLALLAEEIIEEDRSLRTVMPTWELVARLIGQGFYQHLTPPDDLHFVLHQFSLLHLTEGLGYGLEAEPLAVPTRPDESQKGEESEEGSASLFSMRSSAQGFDAMLADDADTAVDLLDTSYDDPAGDEQCASYASYLDEFYAVEPEGDPLAHDDYHLLEAELETLVALQHEFGRLLPEQDARKEDLADRLFLDPDTLFDDEGDLPDLDEPPFWQN
jgi:hypothetical protein